VPNLIVEILGKSNQSHDLITKLNIYMNDVVKEYWIVNPMLDTITVYTLNDDKMYEQHDIKTTTGEITSEFLKGFRLDIELIFNS
jgi:Uma2 family endonuclease